MGQHIYIANAGEATISLVDVQARRVIRTFPGGKGTTALVPTADWRQLWLTAPDEDKVILLDLGTGVPVAAIDVPGEPHSLVLSPDEQWAYVVQRRLHQLAVIDTATRTLRTTIPLGPRPDMLAKSVDGATLYVTVRDDHKLYMISTKDLTVTSTLSTAPDPHGVAYRQATTPATVARAQDTEMGWETGSAAGQGARSPGQSQMMGQGMMGQGRCCGGCMLPAPAPMMEGPLDPLGMMGGVQMDAKTRGQLLQMQGEMLKTMGDIMLKYGQALRDVQ
jgi:hypothetical protein